jgi:hypothetical protein
MASVPRSAFRRDGEGATAVARTFAEMNTRFWASMGTQVARHERPRYILVEVQSHPLLNLSNASFAAIAWRCRGLGPLFVIDALAPADRVALASYPGAAFASFRSWRYVPSRVRAVWQALRAVRGIASPEDLLAVTVDGIRFGDVIYDTVLGTGQATVRRIDAKVLSALALFFLHRSVIADLRRRFDIRAYVGHAVGIPNLVYARYLLSDGIEFFNRTGSHQVQVRKWKTSADVGVYTLKPDPRYFEIMVNGSWPVVEEIADQYLQARFDQQVGGIAENVAFDRSKRLYTSRSGFCDAHGLDPEKPTVFVMLHEFTDFPHSHFRRPMIFRDFYGWFERTVALAHDIRGVNWVFKEHPAAKFYPTSDVDVAEVFAAIDQPHIRFLASDADLNASSLRFIAHAIVTCLGTAGLEYACCGVPCVLASESSYSGYGFTMEPETEAAYEETLRTIAALPRLRPDQIRAAKAVIAFQHVMLQQSEFPLCPPYSGDRVRQLTREDIWRDASERLSPERWPAVRRQVDKLAEFVNAPAWTQFVDPEKYPFMREKAQP